MSFGELFWTTFDRNPIIREQTVLEIGRRLIASEIEDIEWDHAAPALAVMRFREEWDSSDAVAEAAADTLFLSKDSP